MTCSVTHRSLGGLSPWLRLTLPLYSDADGSGLSLTSVAWMDQAGLSARTAAVQWGNGGWV